MTTETADPPYRWIIVFAAAAMLGISMGFLVNGLSAFFLPLESEFSASRAAIALINSFGLVGIALGGIVVGIVADRTDIRKIAIAASLVIGITTVAASWTTALWQLYALFFVSGLLGGGALFAPLIALVGSWFRVGSGLAIGIASAGHGVGQGAVPFGAALLIESMGWRGAMTALGIITLATLLPLAMLLRHPPAPAATTAAVEESPQLPTGLVIVAMSVAVLGCCAGMSVPLMHLVPLIQGCGISGPEAGSVLLTLMIAAVVGRVAFGKLADMIGAIPAYMTSVAWQTLLVFGFTFFGSLEAFYVFAAIYGFGYGGVMTGVLTSTRVLTPPARRASATGIVLAFAWLGHGLGGWQGGLFYDLTGSYGVSYANAAFAGVVNLAIMGSILLALYRVRMRGGSLAGK